MGIQSSRLVRLCSFSRSVASDTPKATQLFRPTAKASPPDGLDASGSITSSSPRTAPGASSVSASVIASTVMPATRRKVAASHLSASSGEASAEDREHTFKLNITPSVEPCTICNQSFKDHEASRIHFESHYANESSSVSTQNSLKASHLVQCPEPTCLIWLQPQDADSHNDFHASEKLENQEILKRKRDEERALKELRREYLGPFHDDEPDRKKLRTRTSKLDQDQHDVHAIPQVVNILPDLPSMSTPIDTAHADIIPIIYRHLQTSYRGGVTRAAYLCSPSVDQIRFGRADWGWACGYRNCQMLLSYLVNTGQANNILSDVPDIRTLQHVIHRAWEQGFDPTGYEQLSHVIDTRKWIGTSEVFVIMSALHIPSQVCDFSSFSNDKSKISESILDFVEHYYSQPDLTASNTASPESSTSLISASHGSHHNSPASSMASSPPAKSSDIEKPSKSQMSKNGPRSAFDVLLAPKETLRKTVFSKQQTRRLRSQKNGEQLLSLSTKPDKCRNGNGSSTTPQLIYPHNDPTLIHQTPSIVMTDLPPLYFQHSGHSRTIIGIEKLCDGTRNLLVFDPSKVPTRVIMKQAKEWRLGVDINSDVGTDSNATASDVGSSVSGSVLSQMTTGVEKKRKESGPLVSGGTLTKEHKAVKSALRNYRVGARDIQRHNEYQILKVITEHDGRSDPPKNLVQPMTPEQSKRCKIINSVRVL